MKFSKNLLSKFVNISDNIEDLCNNLTLKSFEVEWIESRILPELLVIWKCTSVSKHPDADKLNVCQVDCWSHGIFQILTGGENIAADKFVPVALPWCTLPHIWLEILPRKMRGMESNGMICSKWEIGINEDEENHWIWLLEEDFSDLTDADIGKALSEKYPRLADDIFEVKNIAIANRSDLTWHMWLAYEVSAIYNQEMVSYGDLFAKPELPAWQKTITDQTNWLLRNYHIVEIENAAIKKSNFSIRTMCRDFEVIPRNSRVDYSNISMNISCQPLHFFDKDKIDGDVYISLANDGEEFVDLFGQSHTLTSNDIVIKDNSKTIALAWVMWWLNSSIDENTKNILVEIANFDPIYIRKTATRLNLRSDASGRFEKNINPFWTTKCANMLVNELSQYKSYYSSDMWDYNIVWLTSYENSDLIIEFEHAMDINVTTVNEFIFGEQSEDYFLSAEDIVNILTKLWFECETSEETITVTSPSWRNDISNLQDIYEEIARIYGYDNIPENQFLGKISSPNQTNIYTVNRKSEDFWLANKYNQVETYPRISDSDIVRYGFDNPDCKLIKMYNTVDEKNSHLRPAISPSLVNNIINNHKFYDNIKIFDIAKTYIYKDCSHNDQANIFWNIAGTAEHFWVAIASYSNKSSDRKSDNTLSLKSEIKNYINKLGITWEIKFVKSSENHFHPNKQATIYIWETAVGGMGQIHPLILDESKLPSDSDLAVVELNLSLICDLISNEFVQPVYYNQQDQLVDRDLSFVMPTSFDYGLVLAAAKSVTDVIDVKVFDIYQIDSLTKSIGIKIYILGDGTWTTDQINAVMANCRTEVEKLGEVKLRE